MSFRDYYRNKYDEEPEERKGSFQQYHEKRQSERKKEASTSNSGGTFLDYHKKRTQLKAEEAKANQELADYFSTGFEHDPIWQDIKKQQQATSTTNPIDLTTNPIQSNPSKITATITNKTPKKEDETFFDKAGEAASNALNATGNFFKGVGKGVAKGVLGSADFAYNALFGGANSSGIPQKEITTREGKKLTGQAAADYLNNDKELAALRGNGRYEVNKKGYIELVKPDHIQDFLDDSREALTPKENASKSEKIGSAIGDVATQVGQLGTISQATQGLKMATNPAINKILQGGATGAMNSLVNSGINKEEDLGQIAKDAARGGLFFAAGTGASEATGSAIEKVLIEKGLQNNIPAYIAEEVLKGAAFSAAGEAATLPTYPLMGDEAPTAGEIGMDIATGAIYDIVGGLMHIPGLKKQSQAVIKQAQDTLSKSGEMISTLEQIGHRDIDTMNTLYDAMQRSIKDTRQEVLNTRLLGQETEVQQYLRDLDNISTDLWNRQQPYLKAKEARAAEQTTKIPSDIPMYGQRVSRPYTPIDNGVIYQEGSSYHPKDVAGEKATYLTNSNYGNRVGKPYTNVDNGIIHQGGENFKPISQPQATEPNKKVSTSPVVKKDKLTFSRYNPTTKQNEEFTFEKGEKVLMKISDGTGKTHFVEDCIRGIKKQKGMVYVFNNNAELIHHSRVYKLNDNTLQATGQATEPQKLTEPIKTTPKIQNLTESEIEQNTTIPRKVHQPTMQVETMNPTTGKVEKVVYNVGDKIKVYPNSQAKGKGKFEIDEITDTYSTERKKFVVTKDHTYIDVALIEKIEPTATEQATEPPKATEPIKTVSQTQNLTESEIEQNKAKQQEVEPQQDVDTFKEVRSRMNKGEATLEEVKAAYQYVIDNEAEIKVEANKLSVAELKKRVNTFDTSRMKKADLVNEYYEDQITDFIYLLSGDNFISTTYSETESTFEQYKKQAKQLVETIDETTFAEKMATRKAKIEERTKEREAYKKSIETPETLEDFAKAKKRRKLTTEEERAYDKLKAQDERQKRKEAQEQKVKEKEERAAAYQAKKADTIQNGEIPAFTISEDTHDKTGEKLYILKFNDRLESEDFKKASSYLKAKGAYYSRYKKGYIFKEYPSDLVKNSDVNQNEELTEVNPVNQVNEQSKMEEVKETQAEKLHAIADKMQVVIDDGRKERLENTAKRQREAQSAREYADREEQKQAFVRKIAAKAEAGELVYLDELSTKVQFDTLDKIANTAFWREKSELQDKLKRYPNEKELAAINRVEAMDHAVMPIHDLPTHRLKEFANTLKDTKGCKQDVAKLFKIINEGEKDGYIRLSDRGEELVNGLFAKAKAAGINEYWFDYVKGEFQAQNRLRRMGIESDEALREALREFETIRAESVIVKSPEQLKAERLKELERQADRIKIDGYFPTPKRIVTDMIALAEIKEGEKVLEPSAGSGDIADEIGVGKVDVVEWDGLLSQILKEKGHNVIGHDALQVEGMYDKIVMNPPFEKNQDIKHVTKLFNENLNPGGRIVAITSAHFTFANDKASQAFRELVESNGYYIPLPEGSFKESRRSTGVNTCMVVLDKEAAEPIYYKDTNGAYQEGQLIYADDFGAYYEVKTAEGKRITVSEVLTETDYAAKGLQERAEEILTAQTQAIQEKEIMAQQAKDVVDFLKAQKDGKKPMKIYFSPELSGVDNIRTIGQYLKFTDNPRDYKLDTFQIDLAEKYPEISDMGLEEFGTWLVDQVTKFREDKKLLEKAELSHKEALDKLNISPKDMQSVKKLEAAIKEVEENLPRFPLNLQFFAEQQLKQYKSLLRQLKSEGVCQATLDRVSDLQKKYRQARKALENQKARYENKVDKLTETHKAKLQEVKAKNKEKLDNVKLKAEQKLKDEKAKRLIDKFNNMSKVNAQKVAKKARELLDIANGKKFNLEPETKEAIQEVVSILHGTSISTKSEKALQGLNKALDRMKAYESVTGVSDAMKERISEIKTIDEDLTYEQFMDIYNTVKVLLHENKMKNQFLTSKRIGGIKEAVEEVKRLSVRKLKKPGRGLKVNKTGVITMKQRLDDKVLLTQLPIKNLCAKLEGTSGGPLKEILYTNIVKGHTKKYAYLKKSMEFFAEELKSVDMKVIDEGTYKLVVDEKEGEYDEIVITSLEKIALALNSKNKKNRYSLIEGGFARNNTDIICRISDYELDQLFDNLNKDERKIVDAIFKYFATLNQNQLNEVTMTLWNYEAAHEEWYYPKKVVLSHVKIVETADLEGENASRHSSARNLENADFLKPKTMTKTPINLVNPLEVVMQMMNETADLAAYAPALRDARLFLKKLKPFIKNNYSTTMYSQLVDYVAAMTKPNNTLFESDKLATKLYNNTVTAIFGLNVSTALKQPLGIINAATDIEGKYLLKAMVKSPIVSKAKKEIIHQYAPYLWYRGLGHINRELSETNMKQSVDRTFYHKQGLRSLITKHITETDMFVAYRLWDACENEIKATTDYKVGSEEYYKAVGERATELVLATQSNGEVTHRSQLMRSDNIWKKSFTAFQGQLQTGFAQLDYAVEELKETKNIGRFTKKYMLIALIPIIGGMAVDEVYKILRGKDTGLYVKFKRAEQSGIGMEEVQQEFIEKLVGDVLSYNIWTGLAYDTIQSATNFYGASSNNPLYRELQNLAKGVGYLKKGDTEKAAEYGLEALMKLSSIPVDNIQNLSSIAQTATMGGYDYNLTDEGLFDTYTKEVKTILKEYKDNLDKLSEKQIECLYTMKGYSNAVDKIDQAITTLEEIGGHDKDISQLQLEKDKLIKEANSYFSKTRAYIE